MITAPQLVLGRLQLHHQLLRPMFFYGNNSTVSYAAYNQDGLLVDLRNTDKYKSIKAVTASSTNAGTYIGAANAATTIDASGAAASSAIWGGSANARYNQIEE